MNLALSEVKAQSQVELRAKVLNALRASSEVSEINVNYADGNKVEKFKIYLKDLKIKSGERIR